ncbi:hypothetical protein [Methanonatronarchaeum sp. AMET-Sl]|uniref:hypothetical protein n=1 Tax=Methanonatronarchaeum sp. AMET-Sl TaxID=3037654 RepID=UPI00244E21C2|nr:hypothetical protein [Methanonatronarchaeum sp. AMET-Sl]WGI17882.1 hypothetical protein QEN48_02430 [Methanonatronarchaeum sp. AMET-Sl]
MVDITGGTVFLLGYELYKDKKFARFLAVLPILTFFYLYVESEVFSESLIVFLLIPSLIVVTIFWVLIDNLVKKIKKRLKRFNNPNKEDIVKYLRKELNNWILIVSGITLLISLFALIMIFIEFINTGDAISLILLGGWITSFTYGITKTLI